MRIEKLNLKGITAFRESISLDLTTLPQGLIAIVGPNGHGKTTLLESLGPAPIYREFPSRAEKPLFDYATGTDSYIEQIVTLDGRGTYRCRVNLDQPHRKSDAIIQRVGEAYALNDGKTSTYDAQIAKHFPSQRMVLASAFAAQNRAGSFVTGGRGDRKQLFAELLELGHLEDMATTARTIATALERRRIAIRTQLDSLEAETRPEILAAHADESDRLQVEIGRIEALAATIDATLASTAADVAAARTALDAGRESLRDRDTLSTRYRERHDQVQQIRAELSAIASRLTARKTAASNRLAAELIRLDERRKSIPTEAALDAQLQSEIRLIDASLATEYADIDERLANNQRVLANAENIRASEQRVKALTESIATARERVRVHRQERDARRVELDTQRRAIDALSVARADLAHAERQAALLDRMPCHGVAPYDGCEFLKDATAAKQRIEALTQQLAGLAEAKAAVVELETLDAADAVAIDAIEREIGTHEHELTVARAIADQAARLAMAETRVADLQAQRAAASERAAAARAAAQVRIDGQRQQAQEQHDTIARDEDEAARVQDAELTAAIADADAEVADARHRETVGLDELTAIANKIAALPPAVDVAALEQQLTSALIAEQQAQATRTALAADRARYDADARHHAAIERQLNQRITERDGLRAAFAALDRDLVEWQVLASALGKDGLQVLEMDAAGPAVSDLANDLLEYALGSRRFTLELITQEAKVSGKGLKETFDLRVYDTERGSAPRDVGDLSGGEQVLIDEALKGAIALYHNARNVQPMRTCWRDETTGALDAENALRYMAMLRRIQQRGGFERLYVISHNAEAAALADAQLYVHDGQVDVVLPPFNGRPHQEAA